MVVRWKSLALVLFVLMVAGAELSAAVRSVPLLISTKRLERLDPQKTKLVHVDSKEYKELLKKYRLAHEAVEKARKGDEEPEEKGDKNDKDEVGKVTVLSAKLGSEQIGDRLAGKFEIDVRLTKDGPFIVPIELRELAIKRAFHQGPKGSEGTLVLGNRGRGNNILALLTGAGDHKLLIDGSFPITEDGGVFSCHVKMPGAAIQTVNIKLQGKELNVRRDKIRNLPFEITPLPLGQTEIAGACGNRHNVFLSWSLFSKKKALVKKRKVEQPRLFSTLSGLLLIKDELTLSFSHIQVVNSGGPTASLDVLLPPGATPKSVAGPLVRKAILLRESQGRRLRVLLREALKGTTTLQVLAEASGRANRTVELVPSVLANAQRQQVTVGVTALCPAELVTKKQGKGVRLVDPASLPKEITGQSVTPVVLAYGYTLAKGEKLPPLSVAITPFTTEKTLETTINSSNAVTVIKEVQRANEKKKTLTSMTRLILQVVNGSRKHLLVKLPAKAEVTGCFVNFESANPAIVKGGEGKTILVPLIKSVHERDGLLPYPVSLTYRLDLAEPLGHMGTLSYSLPSFDVPVSDTSWKVYTPEGYTFLDFVGNVKDAKQLREFILIRAADWLFNDVVMTLIGVIIGLGFLVLLVLVVLKGVSGLRAVLDELRSSGCGSLLLGGMFVFTIIGMLAAISVPNFRKARARANSRSCYANQKTVAGALEMYNLDNNVSINQLTDDVWQNLRDQGYLQTIPDDPGFGSGTHHNYRLTPEGDIYCTCHGGIQANPANTGYHRAFKKRAAQFKRQQVAVKGGNKNVVQGGRSNHIAPVNFRIPKTGQFTLLLRSFLVANDKVHFSADYLSAQSFKAALFIVVILAGLLVLALNNVRGILSLVILLLLLVAPALLDELHPSFARWFFFGTLVYLIALRGKLVLLRTFGFVKELLASQRATECEEPEAAAAEVVVHPEGGGTL